GTAGAGSDGDPIDTNIYVSDDSYGRIRVLCLDTTTGFCNGKIQGNLYRVAGKGSTAALPRTSNLPASEVAFTAFGSNGVAVGTDAEIYIKSNGISVILP